MSQHSQETEVANGPLQDVDFEKQTQHSRETEETKETVPPVDTTEKPIGEPLEKVESEFKYPNTKSLILIMLALYLSVFLVALVCFSLSCNHELKNSSNCLQGPDDYSNCYSSYHRRVRFSRGCWLVW
jgi:hypothetical protein